MIKKIKGYKEELMVAAIFFPIYAYFFWCCLPLRENTDYQRALYLTFTYITFAMALGACGKKPCTNDKSEVSGSNMLLIVKTMVFIVASVGFFGTIV